MPVKQVKAQKVQGYDADIPTVLVVMKDYLMKNGGPELVCVLVLSHNFLVFIQHSYFVGGHISARS